MMMLGLSVPVCPEVISTVVNLDSTFYLQYSQNNVELCERDTLDNACVPVIVEDDEADEEHNKIFDLLIRHKFASLLAMKGRSTNVALYVLKFVPIALHTAFTTFSVVRICPVLKHFGSTDLFFMYLIVLLIIQLNSLFTHLLFLYMGGSLRMMFIQVQTENVLAVDTKKYTDTQRRVYFAVQATMLVVIGCVALFFFYLRERLTVGYNGAEYTLWGIGTNVFVQKWYGFLSNAVNMVMFFQSAGSIVAFVSSMNSVLEAFNSEMCLSRDHKAYNAAFCKTHYILRQINMFLTPQITTMVLANMMIVVYAAYVMANTIAAGHFLFTISYVFVMWATVVTHMMYTLYTCARINNVVNRTFDNVTLFTHVFQKLDASQKLDLVEMNRIIGEAGIRIGNIPVTNTMIAGMTVWLSSYIVFLFIVYGDRVT